MVQTLAGEPIKASSTPPELMNHRRWSGMLPRQDTYTPMIPTSSFSSSSSLSLLDVIPFFCFSLSPFVSLFSPLSPLFLSLSCSRSGLRSSCLEFTYLGHSSSTMSLCRYFRQRACLGELSLVRLPPFQGGYGARSESRSKSRGKHHFRIVSCSKHILTHRPGNCLFNFQVAQS